MQPELSKLLSSDTLGEFTFADGEIGRLTPFDADANSFGSLAFQVFDVARSIAGGFFVGIEGAKIVGTVGQIGDDFYPPVLGPAAAGPSKHAQDCDVETK